MKKSNVIQVVKWEKTMQRKYEVEAAKRLFWHFFSFQLGYTIGLMLLFN